MQHLPQSLDKGSVHIVSAYHNIVGIGDSRFTLRALQQHSVTRWVQAGGDGVIAVDDRKSHIFQGCGQTLGIHLNNFDLHLAGLDVQFGNRAVAIGALRQDNQPGVLEQQQRACLVGRVIGHSDAVAVHQLVQGLLGACIDAKRLIMHRDDGDQLSGFVHGFVVIVQIGAVLEKVGLIFACGGGGVLQHIAIHPGHLQIIAQGLEVVLDKVKQNLVRVGRSSDADDLFFRKSSQAAKGKNQDKQDNKQFFHGIFLSFIKII